MALLEVQNVTKSFGGLNAVDNVSFSVERGELIGLIGANGAGKTTLFSVIAGNLKPTSGDIRLDGQSIANLPPFRVSQLGIARTFQIVRPFLAMTVEENVEIAALFGRAQQGGVQARVEAAEIIKAVGLASLKARPTRSSAIRVSSKRISAQDLNMLALLEVDDLFAGYGSIRVLNGVSLQVEPGSITALLGSNGAGKTTLMRTIAGLIQPDRGRILHEGKPIHRLAPPQRVEMGIVLVPEGRQVFSDFTVEENLKLGAFVPRARARMSTTQEEIYGFFPKLAERRRQAARTMSGGEQQMLALARGLMPRPRLLMLDEPSRGLAPVITEQLFQIIERIRDNGVTIFIVEQNVQTTLQIADQAYVLDQGKVVLQGAGAALAKEPRIRAAYLGM